MAKPLEHATIALVAVQLAQWSGFRPNERIFVLGSMLPDLDFLLFVPVLGRVRGHRTITHSPVFQIFFAVIFHKYGFGSLLSGMLLHSLVDAFLGRKPSTGLAWLWPFMWERF